MAETSSACPHHRHRLPQIPRLAAVKIGWRQLDIAERRDTEHVLVADRFCDLKAALVSRRQDISPWPLDDAERRIHLPADVDARVATGAALIHEQLQPFLLFCGHSIRIDRRGSKYRAWPSSIIAGVAVTSLIAGGFKGIGSKVD